MTTPPGRRSGTAVQERGGTEGRTPPVDPRIRHRRQEVARRAGRRRLRWVLMVLAVLALVAGAWMLLHSRWFSARVVTVTGSVHTPRSAVVAAAGLAGHPALLDVNPAAAAAGIERLPWVATATVRREWPDGVAITVVERTPVAVVPVAAPAPGTAGWAEVDRAGRVLALSASPPPGLVKLQVPGHPGRPGTVVAATDLPALAVAATLPRAFVAQVATVVAGPGGTITLDLTSPITVDLGTTSQLTQKYEDVAAILHGAPLTAGDVINVVVPDSPAVGQG